MIIKYMRLSDLLTGAHRQFYAWLERENKALKSGEWRLQLNKDTNSVFQSILFLVIAGEKFPQEEPK